jgi:hypothetical protein
MHEQIARVQIIMAVESSEGAGRRARRSARIKEKLAVKTTKAQAQA